MNDLMNNVTVALTEQRVALDACKHLIGQLPKSRGTALAFTALEKGRMYVGEMCRELGKEYPYEATKTATTAEGIQDAVDISPVHESIGDNEIVALNKIREKLDKELDEFNNIVFNPVTGLSANFKPSLSKDKFAMDCAVSEAYRGLKEARMWLGIRLGELRDLEKGKGNTK